MNKELGIRLAAGLHVLLGFVRGILEIQGYGRREHLDMADLFGSRFKKQVAILLGTATPPGLEQILKADPDLPFDPSYSLLKHLRIVWIWFFNLYLVPQFAIVIKHIYPPCIYNIINPLGLTLKRNHNENLVGTCD